MRAAIHYFALAILAVSMISASSALGEPQEKLIRATIIYKESPKGHAELNALNHMHSKEGIESKVAGRGGKVRYNFSSISAVSTEIPESEIAVLERDPNVLAVERSRPVHAFLQESVPLINGDDTWNILVAGLNVTGQGTSVCVIDTGVDYTHPDLGGGWGNKVVAGYNAITDTDCSLNNTACLDDYGHGTHVAGIVAANGAVKGVAPGAKIVAVKALDAGGSGSLSDVDAGIDWCISNAAQYNITSISMSLGTWYVHYSSFCDNDTEYISTKSLIDAAVGKNISVVVATGNEHNYAGISAPACIRNATRVTATDKSGNYADFANRAASFPDILAAPGVDINSTVPSGSCKWCAASGYRPLGGTSMSTPHVSGAISLISQAYKSMYGFLPSPALVEAMLIETGKKIYDSKTGINFSRINVLAALGSFTLPDTFFPYNNITGESAQITINESESVYFNISLGNETEFLWYLNGIMQNNSLANYTWHTDFNSSGTWAMRTEAANNYPAGSFTWNITVLDVPLAITSGYPQENFTAEENTVNSINLTTSRNTTQNTWLLDGVIVLNDSHEINISWNCTSEGMHNITYLGGDGFDNVQRNWLANVTKTNCPPYISPPLERVIMQRQNQTTYNISLNIHDDDGDAITVSADDGNISVDRFVLNFNYSSLFENKSVTITLNDSLAWVSQPIYITVIDTLGPGITINSPTNSQYNTTDVALGFSLDEEVEWCGYSLNGAQNETLPSCAGTTIAASVGDNNITIYANDTVGNIGTGTINFTVNVAPLEITVFSENYTTSDFVFINATVSKAPQYCILDFNGTGYPMNTTGMSCNYNVTSIPPGRYNFSIFANDSAGNWNRTTEIHSVQVYYCYESYGEWSGCASGKKHRAHMLRNCDAVQEEEPCISFYSISGGGPVYTPENTTAKNETKERIIIRNETRNETAQQPYAQPAALEFQNSNDTGQKTQFVEEDIIPDMIAPQEEIVEKTFVEPAPVTGYFLSAENPIATLATYTVSVLSGFFSWLITLLL